MLAENRRCQDDLEEVWADFVRQENRLLGVHENIHLEWCDGVEPLAPEPILHGSPFDWGHISAYPTLALEPEVEEFRAYTTTTFNEYMAQDQVVDKAWEIYQSKLNECNRQEEVLAAKIKVCDEWQEMQDSTGCTRAEAARDARRAVGDFLDKHNTWQYRSEIRDQLSSTEIKVCDALQETPDPAAGDLLDQHNSLQHHSQAEELDRSSSTESKVSDELQETRNAAASTHAEAAREARRVFGDFLDKHNSWQYRSQIEESDYLLLTQMKVFDELQDTPDSAAGTHAEAERDARRVFGQVLDPHNSLQYHSQIEELDQLSSVQLRNSHKTSFFDEWTASLWLQLELMCVVSIAILGSREQSGPQSKLAARTNHVGLNFLATIFAGVEAARICLFKFLLPNQHNKRKTQIVHNGLDKEGFPLVRTQDNFERAISVAHTSGRDDLMFRLLKEMQFSGIGIAGGVFSKIFRKLRPSAASTMLRSMVAAGVAPNIVMYNCVLGAYVHAGEVQRARGVIQEMRKVVGTLDDATYSLLFQNCYALDDWQGIHDLLKEMTALGHKVKTTSYNNLLNICASKGYFQIAFDTIDMMKENGVPMDTYAVSIMMKALHSRNSDDYTGAICARVFALLDDSAVDVCADEVCLTTVVGTCVWHNEVVRLGLILEGYFKSEFQPTVSVYGPLLQAAKTVKRIDLLWRLWGQLEGRKLKPTPIVLGCMLDALVCNSCLEEALAIFQEWKSMVPPNTVMYSILLKGFLYTNHSRRALAMLWQMQAEGVARSMVNYNMVIRLQTQHGSMDDVPKLMRDIVADDLTPDIITYSNVVKGYCKKGDIDSALATISDARSRSVALDAAIYGLVFNACFHHGRFDLVDQLVAASQADGIRSLSPASLDVIVEMYGMHGQIDRAFEVVESLSPGPVCSDARVAHALLRECLRNSHLDHAQRVWKELVDMPGGPDFQILCPLVSLLVQEGRFSGACSVVETWRTLSVRQVTFRRPDLTQECLPDSLVLALLLALKSGSEVKAVAALGKLRATESQAQGRKGDE